MSKIIKFPALPRVPLPPPTIPHRTEADEARVNTKVRIRKDAEEGD